MLVRGGKAQTGRSYSNNGQKIVTGNISAISGRANLTNKTKLQAIDQLQVRKGLVKPTEKEEPVHLQESPQTVQTYSGFPSIQLESYYDRIQMKVMEFLCSFIVQCLTKELANSASQGAATANKAVQCNLNTAAAGSAQPEASCVDNDIEESFLQNIDDGKSIVETGLENYIAEQQIDQFIKKIMKVYKALRVLERNKSKDTPIFSRAIEKLIRYFSKAFPENFGIEGNLNDLNVSSHGQSTASNFYRSSTFHSEFSDFAEELREINKLAEGKQNGSSNNNFNFIDYSKISNDSNSVNADTGNESKTELLGGLAQRRMSNEKSPSSNNFTNRALEPSTNRRETAMQPLSTIGAYRDLSQEELAVRIGGQPNQNDQKNEAKLDISNNFDQFSHTSQMSQLSSQIVQESGQEAEAFSKHPRSLRKVGGGKWKRNQTHVKVTQGILKTSSTQPIYQQMSQARGGVNAILGESPIIQSSKLNCDLQNIDHSTELPTTSNNVQFADDLKVIKKSSKSQQNKIVENPQFNSQFGHVLQKQNQLPTSNKTNYLRPVEEIFERKEMEEVDEDTKEHESKQYSSLHPSPMAENLHSVQSWPHSTNKAAQIKNDSVYQTYSQIVSGQQSSMAQQKFLHERTKVISQQQQRSRSSTAKSQPNGVESLDIQQKLANVNAPIEQNVQMPPEPFSVRIKNGKKFNLQGNYQKFANAGSNIQRLAHKSNTYQTQTQSRMNHQHIHSNYQQPQVSRNKSSSQVKQSIQRSTLVQDMILGSSDAGEYLGGAFLAQNIDNSVDQDSILTHNSTQIHVRQNKKLLQRQHNGPNSYLNKRYSQAAYKSQPRTGLTRDLGGSSSNQNINNNKQINVFQTTKNSNYGANQKAMSLVYTNQANIHNNMLMRQQQQLQQLYQFQQQIMNRNTTNGNKTHQDNNRRPLETSNYQQTSIPQSQQQQFVTFNNTPINITQGEQEVQSNYEYEIGTLRNKGTESSKAIPTTIVEDTEANEISHQDKTT